MRVPDATIAESDAIFAALDLQRARNATFPDAWKALAEFAMVFPSFGEKLAELIELHIPKERR